MKFNLNTWLILIWVLLASVLVIENMVVWMIWYLFLDPWANVGIVVFVAVIIWIMIWYWIKWNMTDNNNDDYDENEDYKF